MRLSAKSVAGALLVGVTVACATAPTQPAQEAYQPKFSYKAPASAQKIDVTVGIMAPQFAGDGLTYYKGNKDNDVVRGMLRGIRTGFSELMVAKGFNAAGPFDSLDAMTFPEKKGSDFILYPEFDLEAGQSIGNLRRESPPLLSLDTQPVLACDILIQPKGIVSIVALEPLSKETMWRKKVEVAVEEQRFPAKGVGACSQGSFPRVLQGSPAVQNGWAKAHEAVYTEVMTSLDKYVSAEEFQMLKKQAAELRAKKTY